MHNEYELVRLYLLVSYFLRALELDFCYERLMSYETHFINASAVFLPQRLLFLFIEYIIIIIIVIIVIMIVIIIIFDHF